MHDKDKHGLPNGDSASLSCRRPTERSLFVALWDIKPEVVLAWMQVFAQYRGVSFGCDNILRARVDAVVSPANSFGYMDGGIDLAYRNFFGLGIQRRVHQVIAERFKGELPVGHAIAVPTGHKTITRLIVAPTMTTPRRIRGTQNVYLATRAALTCALQAQPPIARLGMPGMGTGVGGMDPSESAEQMCRAFVEVIKPKKRCEADE
jgi:O-acetyl-ADP-ribose deacetylase (regulator of RNase III)